MPTATEPASPSPAPAPSPSPVRSAAAPTPEAPADIPIPCPACAYDLRGNASGRCPECGIELDEEALSTRAAIPWQSRHKVGRLQAFVRTVSLALRHPAQLARQAGREVDYRSARLFQLICCTLAWLCLLPICPLLWYGVLAADPAAPRPLSAALADLSLVLALGIGLLFWLLTATGLPSYFFHPRALATELQDRAIAISYYSAAPLALIPVAGVITLLVVLFLESWRGSRPILIEAAGLTLVGSVWFIILVELMALPLVMLAKGLHASGVRIFLCWATLMVGWPLLFAAFVVGLPALALYVQLVYHTLR